jgi:F-type H+-transporting ATPase subunit gamma
MDYSLLNINLNTTNMANLKEIRNRITSVSSTMQISNENGFCSSKETRCNYSNALICRKLTELLQNLSATLEGDAGDLLQREVKSKWLPLLLRDFVAL